MAKQGKLTTKTKEECDRPRKIRCYKQFYLIVCEDESTEPYYFEKFKSLFEEIYPNETVLLVPVGTGRNSLGVVNRAIQEKENSFQNYKKQVDEVWAVFDKDDLDKSEGNIRNFEKAFEIAKSNGINIAYSNECFELWLLLHLEDVSPKSKLPRTELYQRLENAINKGRTEKTKFTYNHGAKDAVDLVMKAGDENKAIKRADSLNKYHEKEGNTPISSNPNTKVNELVRQLRNFLDWYKSNT